MGTALRKYVSDFTVAVGPIVTSGHLLMVTKSGKDDYKKFTAVCPECPKPTKTDQKYICPQGHGPFDYQDLTRAKKLDDSSIVPVDATVVAETQKSTLPLNIIKATVHPPADVWNSTYTGDNAYVFVPRIVDEYHALLVRLVSESGHTFVGLCNLRNNEGLFRLDVWQGYIVVQKLLWPEECNEFPTTEIDGCDDDTLADFVAVLERKAQPFVASEYRNTARDRLEALNASLAGEEVPASAITIPTPAPKPNLRDLLAAF